MTHEEMEEVREMVRRGRAFRFWVNVVGVWTVVNFVVWMFTR
jgi:hypothetical protein